MSQQIICDGCGEPIDQTVTYFTANVMPVQLIDGVLVGGDPGQQKDYHTEHLPADAVAG